MLRKSYKNSKANVSSIKDLPNRIEQETITLSKFRVDGRPRSSIGDLCDFCLKSIYVRKQSMALRKKGYKFGCFECHKNGKFKWKDEGGDGKVLPQIPHKIMSNLRKFD